MTHSPATEVLADRHSPPASEALDGKPQLQGTALSRLPPCLSAACFQRLVDAKFKAPAVPSQPQSLL